MATLNVRILNKIDTLENWQASSLKIKEGEICLATVAAAAGNGLTEPVVMAKIGTAEEKTFSELPWAFHAKASDVLAACKSEAALKTFVNGVIADAGIATNDAMEALAGKVTTAEGKITALENELNTESTGLKARMTAAEGDIDALEGLVGDKKVSEQISQAIADLKLGETYAAKALETTVANHVADTVAHVTTADKTTWNSALQASDIAVGSANGTVSVKGSDVAVKGLGSAAFTEASAYDAAGSAAAAQAAAEATAKAYADGLAGNYDAAGSASAAESAAKAYADGLAANYDAAGDAAQALEDAKDYTDSEMTRLVGDKTVGTQITEAITGLDLANSYDAKGAAAAAETAAKTHANNLNTAMNTRVEALEAIDHDHSNKAELDKIADGDVAKWNAAEQNAKDYADGLDEAMDGRVAAIEAKFGDGEGNVEAQIAAAVEAEAKLRKDADDAQVGRIAALEGLVGDEAVATQISDAVEAEAKIARAAEEANAKAIADEKTRAEGAEADLQTQINTIMNNPDTEGVINSINEFTQYIADHGEIAEGFRTDIDANAKAIADEATRAAGVEGGLDTRLKAVEAASTTHAAAADLTALAGRVTTAEGEIDTLQGEMDTVEGKVAALEGLVGDEAVATQISTAVAAEAAIARAAEEANAKAIDALEAKAPTWDAAVQTVVAEEGLTATKSGTEVTIGFDEEVVFIFDCGSSAE